MRARYQAWVLLLALGCAGAPSVVGLVCSNTLAPCCASEACCRSDACSAASHRAAGRESCRMRSHAGTTATGGGPQGQMNCSCRVSHRDTSLSNVKVDLRFEVVAVAELIPPPLLVLPLTGIRPVALEGHLRPLDHPPKLLS